MSKREYSAPDANPVVLYAKKDVNETEAFPVLATSSGSLKISEGFDIPEFDTLDLGYDGTIVNKLTFSLITVTVATLTLTNNGTSITRIKLT